jgi:cytochrome c5
MQRGPATVIALALLGIACRGSGPAPSASAADTSHAAAMTRSDAILLAAAKTALPPEGVNPGNLPDSSSAGAHLLAQYCNQCHALPSPLMHSATDWPRILRRMWLRMDRLPDSLGIRTADEGDRVTVLNYLTANALRVSGSALPPGDGREEFAMICSRCHALPDIRIHSSRDWPSVFLRMEGNMQRMNVSRPNEQQTGKILTYLQNAAKP